MLTRKARKDVIEAKLRLAWTRVPEVLPERDYDGGSVESHLRDGIILTVSEDLMIPYEEIEQVQWGMDCDQMEMERYVHENGGDDPNQLL